MTTTDERILAIDVGTSSVRATALTVAGQVVASHTEPTPSQFQPDGKVTVDPDELWQLVATAIRHASHHQAIAAVGVTAQLGIVLVDAAHRPVAPALLWPDTRAREQSSRVADARAQIPAFQPGRRASGESTAARLLWFAEHEPQQLRRAAQVLSLKDWLVLALTGEASTDPVHAGYSLLFDVTTGRWSEQMFDALDLPASLAPPIRDADAIAGVVTAAAASATGVRAGTVVSVGGPDGTVGSLGAGAAHAETVDIAGSTDVLVHPSDIPLIDPLQVVTTNAYLTGKAWTVGGATALTGGAMQWLARLLGFPGPAELLDRYGEQAGTLEAGAHPLMDPALGDHRFPYGGQRHHTGIAQLHLDSGPAHLVAAANEGAAFTIRDGLTELARLGAQPSKLIIVGGLARDPHAVQLRADVCNIDVRGISDGLASSRGAAMLASVAAGIHGALPAASAALRAPGRDYRPDTARVPIYQQRHAQWHQIFHSA
ncbi:MAG: xylulokinase [Beutenbergiaceae bacterium]